ncbi:hypothetical protein GXW74_26335 [Roseomonas eburnea]|uniref:Uncharacterized protein n=1 Tax=Neoroseomonas eburnea TaxID=1346889 RepID=A0A9X9XJX8_9PROT|nr:hypothetical protein [Neoroseomonas eburnea]MBR0684014.1 hypothetical protein [Neoroseomonas eburnea]
MLAAAPAAAQQEGRPRPFVVMNLGPADIVAVEISPAGEGRYGGSLIGRVELPPGNALHITPPSQSPCGNDLRIRWSNGRTEDRVGEDLCQPQRVLRLSTPGN